jgi:alkaline phosphatase D
LETLRTSQHDAHREAVIDIGKGEYDAAEERIKKVMQDPAALWRSLSNAYERAGRTVKSEGAEYQRFVIPENHFVMAMLASVRGDSTTALASARNAVKAGLPFERLLAGPRDAFSTLHQMKAFQKWADEKSQVLIHGPMLGNITSNGASFWVRTAYETEVQVLVKPIGKSHRQNIKSTVIRTSADKDYTAVVRIDGLRPHTTYDYHLIIQGKTVPIENASFETYPIQGAPHQFSVAFGGGAGYVPENERIWTTIKQREPLAMLMLGDNIYSDDPEQAITQKYCYYRRQSRPEWRQLVAQKGVYAIWDDHDFGTDDSYGGPQIDVPLWKRPVWQVFKENWNNPSYAGGNEQPGCLFDYYIGDVHFIHLDCRYYRESSGRLDPRVDQPSMLGPVQLDWLKKILKNSKGTFKVLISSVPWAPGTKGSPPGGLDTWDGYTEERDTIYNCNAQVGFVRRLLLIFTPIAFHLLRKFRNLNDFLGLEI